MFKEFEMFLKRNNIWHEFLERQDMSTVGAASLHMPADRIAKSIVFEVRQKSDKESILVILPGSRNVSRKKLRPIVGKENIKLASADDVLRVTGFEVGAVPPIGHKNKIKCILDEHVALLGDVWAGGGAVNKLVHLKVSDIIKFSNPIVADVSE